MFHTHYDDLSVVYRGAGCKIENVSPMHFVPDFCIAFHGHLHCGVLAMVWVVGLIRSSTGQSLRIQQMAQQNHRPSVMAKRLGIGLPMSAVGLFLQT